MSQHPTFEMSSSREPVLYAGQKDALTQILAGIETARWVLLIGPEGSGKSVILQALLAQFSSDADVVDCDGFEVSEPDDLMTALRDRLMVPEAWTRFWARRHPAEELVAGRQSRTNPLAIIVDNAHALSQKSLKLLADVVRKTPETNEGGGAWVILAGPPALEPTALRARGEIKYLRCTPGPLTPDEVALHIERRMRAGPEGAVKIPRDAVAEIARCTAGIPGRIDTLCNLVAMSPSVRLNNVVSVEVVQTLAERLGLRPSFAPTHRASRDPSDGESPSSGRRWRQRIVVSLLILAVVGATALGYSYGMPLARTGAIWAQGIYAQLFPPPQPPPPPPAPERAGRARAPRRETTARPAPSPGPTAAVGSTVERRSTTDQPKTSPRLEPVRQGPPPISPAQTAALLESARAGRVDDVTRLLGAGVPAEVRDAGGVTPLMHAILHGHVDAARALLAKGAQVNSRDRGGITPTMLAVIHEQPDALDILLERGADVNAKSGSGWTALTFAAWKGDPDVTRTLLRHGADRSVVDKQGWTPLDYATANLNSSATELEALDSPARPPQGGRHAEVVPLLQGAARP